MQEFVDVVMLLTLLMRIVFQNYKGSVRGWVQVDRKFLFKKEKTPYQTNYIIGKL